LQSFFLNKNSQQSLHSINFTRNNYNFKCHFSSSNNFNEQHRFQKIKEFETPFFNSFQKKYNLSISEIFSLFRKGRFLRFMNENYRMLPFLFSPLFLREVKFSWNLFSKKKYWKVSNWNFKLNTITEPSWRMV
jgi:hypothetical protein